MGEQPYCECRVGRVQPEEWVVLKPGTQYSPTERSLTPANTDEWQRREIQMSEQSRQRSTGVDCVKRELLKNTVYICMYLYLYDTADEKLRRDASTIRLNHAGTVL